MFLHNSPPEQKGIQLPVDLNLPENYLFTESVGVGAGFSDIV